MRVRSAWLILGSITLLASSAHAESPEHALANLERTHRLWIRGIGYVGKLEGDRVLMIAPRFGGAFLLADTIDLNVEIPMVLAHIDVTTDEGEETETRTLPGNPFVGGSYVAEVRGHRFSAGLGVAGPLAHDKKGDAYDELAYRYARAARAGREAWLYTPDRLSVVVASAFETKVERGPVIGADAALAFMPRVRGTGSSFESTTQIGLSCSAQLGASVRLGGRLDAVLLPSDAEERLQTALVPFLHVSTHDGVLFATELVVNLDDPYGFAFADGGVWGLSVLAGSRF